MVDESSRRTIMVVEESPSIRGLLRDLLESEGYGVLAHADLRAAHQAIDAAGPPDLALVDYRLPDGVGTDLCRNLRERGVPCLVISAHPSSLEPAMDATADVWIGKPFDTSDVLTAVRDLLAG